MALTTQTILVMAVMATALSTGVFVLSKNRRSIVHQSFTLLLAGLVVTIVGFILLSLQYPFEYFDKPIHYGGIIFLLGLLIFSQVFPDSAHVPRGRWPLYLPLGAIAAILPANLIISGAHFDAAGHVVPENGPLIIPYILCWTTYVLLPSFFLIRTYRRSTGRQRMQIQYLFTGFGLLLSSFLICNLILPLFGITSLYFMSALAAVVLIVLTAYAIVRHQLLDIRLVVQRGLIYTILLVIVIGAYLSITSVAGMLFASRTDTGVLFSAGLTTVIGIFGVPFLKAYFRTVTDPIFFKDTYDYASAAHTLTSILSKSLDESEIVSQSEEALRCIFKVAEVHFAFDQDRTSHVSEQEQSPGFETIAMPITFDGTAIGAIRLGKKRSGDRYTRQDAQLFATFAFQAAIAIGKARLHKQVQEYNLHLEELVETRTTEIKQLQEEQKRHMIDISHNLQTPLAVIKGELELLGEDFAESERGRAVGGSLDRVSGFIRQLLRLARMEKQTGAIERVPIDLGALLSEQAEYFEAMAESGGAEIAVAIPAERFALRGNKRLLEELFTNLVANALTYRDPERRASVRITLARDGSDAVISVEDNGVGIAAEDLPRIFERFYRAPGTAYSVSGSGLGLAIAKQIAETHGGSIQAASTLGRGTQITVRLPVA